MSALPPVAGEPHGTVLRAPGEIERLSMADIMALTEDYPLIARQGALTQRAARILSGSARFDRFPVAPAAPANRR